MMEQSLFRNDLYFRLGVITVNVPSLNERKEDIIPLANHFLLTFSTKFHKKYKGISKEVKQALQEHHWVGNVRELKNLIERGVLIGKGPELKLEDMGMNKLSRGGGKLSAEKVFFPDEDPAIPPEGINLMQAVMEYERRYIKAALKHAEGNESKAARLLHMNHYTFRYQKKKIL